MGILDWAKREVEIVCKKERGNTSKDELDYGCACYISALKAFESLCGDGHSGFSITITKEILNRLIDGKPLTPIEDTDDIWKLSIEKEEEGCTTYQCKRMSSLFKDVYNDGRIEYSDINRFVTIDINNPIVSWHSGLVDRVMEEFFPITMLYMPAKPIKVYCEDILTDHKNGDFDTVGIFYAIEDKNGEQKQIEINRFFREPFEGEESKNGWIKIDYNEWCKRIEMHNKRLEKMEANK